MSRKHLDRYYTPQPVADAVVRQLMADRWIYPGILALEPHCGAGAWVRAMNGIAGASVDALDVDPEAVRPEGAGTFEHVDFLSPDWSGEMHWDVIIGNPPFAHDSGRRNGKGTPVMETIFQRHVERALDLADTVIFLLRHSAFASAERCDWWKEHMPAAVYRLFPRPSFTGGGTDSAEYDVFVWRAGAIGRPELWMIDWKRGAR